MNLPIYTISIPNICWRNNRFHRIRSLPQAMVTPISIHFLKWGKVEVKEGSLIQNIEVKTYTVADIIILIKKLIPKRQVKV